MKHIIRYHSSRKEVWNWYWGTWRKKYWFLHVLLAGTVGYGLSKIDLNSFRLSHWALYFTISFPIITLIMAAAPQIMFKNKERVLEVTPEGWSSQICKLSGSRTWKEVASIEEEMDKIIIVGTNGNALIVPSIAFPDLDSHKQFISDIKEWHKQYAG